MDVDWLDQLLKEKHPDIVAKKEEEKAVLAKVASKPAIVPPAGGKGGSLASPTSTARPGSLVGAPTKPSTQNQLDVLNSLFDRPGSTGSLPPGFNRNAYTGSNEKDIEFLMSTKESSDDLWNATRRNLYNFFGNQLSSESLALLKADIVTTEKLRGAKIPELLSLLKHRDENLQEKAVSVIAMRCVEISDPIEKRKNIDDVVKEGGVRNLMTVLNSPRPGVILETLRALTAICNIPEYKEKVRAAGGLKPLVKYVLHTDLTTQLRALTCLHHLAAAEPGRPAIVAAGGIEPLVKALQSRELKVILLTLLVLTSITTGSVKFQELVCQARGLEPTCQLMMHQNEMICLESLRLLQNLSNCDTCKHEMPKETMANLVRFLRLQEVYLNQAPNENKGPRHGNPETIQVLTLGVIQNLATYDQNRITIDGYDAVKRMMAYLKPQGNFHFDIFRWNLDVMHGVLKAFTTLLQYRQARVRFVEQEGANIILKILTLPEIFPKSMIETSAQLMSKISTTEELANAMVGAGVTFLIKTLQQYPGNQTLQLTVVQTIRHLAVDDRNKQTVFEEGGIQLLNQLIKQTQDPQVLGEVAEALAVLSGSKFIRKVQRLLGVSNLISMLSHSAETVQRPAALALGAIASEPEGVELIMKDPAGNAVVGLLGLMQSDNVGVQDAAVGALDNLCTNDEAKMMVVNGGGVPVLLNLLASPQEGVMLKTMQLLTKLAKHPTAKAALDGVGLGQKLVPLKDHENVKKEGSQVIQAYRTLIIAFKSNVAATGAQATAAALASPTGSAYVADPDIDKILSKLATPQLVQLINNLAKTANINLRDFLMKKPGAPPATPAPAAPTAPLGPPVNMKPPPKPPAATKEPDASAKKKVAVQADSDGRAVISLGAIQKAKDKLKITRKLLDQGVVPGKKLYEGSIGRWHEEFQAAVALEKNFLKVIYEVIEIREFDMSWQKAQKLLNSDTMDSAKLADALIKIGLGVKRSLYQTDKGEDIEYEAIILNQELSLNLVLKAIIVATR